MALNFVEIGKRVAELRKRRGISQMALAELIDKSPTFISYIESGLKCMSLDTLIAIANALRVSADELLVDNLDNTVKVSNHEFSSLLMDCSEYEKRVLFSVVESAKQALRDNHHYLHYRK